MESDCEVSECMFFLLVHFTHQFFHLIANDRALQSTLRTESIPERTVEGHNEAESRVAGGD